MSVKIDEERKYSIMMQYSAQRTTMLRWLTIVSAGLLVIALLMNFFYPGTEQSMGEVQRLFYIHLGSFFGSFVMFCAAVWAGIQYLRTRELRWDHLAVAGVEMGLGLSSITIVTGAIWARPIWGAYWTWDPRLTTISIMWLTYAAFLFLRSAIEDPEQKRRFSAIYAILAFGSVILTIVIIRVRPDVIHPVVAGPSVTSSSMEGDFEMSARIAQTVLFNVFSFIVLSIALLWHRIRLENLAVSTHSRKAEVLASL